MPRLIKKGWNFAQVPVWVLCDTRLDDGAKILFAYLDWRQGESDGSWPSVARMAADLGVAEITIQRRLRMLESYGYLETEQRAGRSSFYALNAGNEEAQTFTPRKNDTPSESHPPQKCNPTPLISDTPPPSKMIPITRDINERQERETIGGADAPTPAPPAKAPPSRKEKGPAARDIPAAMIYHDLTRRWPPRVVWDRLRLIANGGLARWGETVKAWLAVGWNPGNLAGMLDCYDRGELPGTRRPERGKPAAVSQAEDDAAWALIQAHIAEREATHAIN